MAWICEECGYTADVAGECPECGIPLVEEEGTTGGPEAKEETEDADDWGSADNNWEED
jgi:uncharacterized Zn finger protein (UPF0148 family)